MTADELFKRALKSADDAEAAYKVVDKDYFLRESRTYLKLAGYARRAELQELLERELAMLDES